ncbi:MAG: plasmid pRiA4b ORF-3 family protein, partial [Treponema sp.]|nr:plasmid pRiA4b ORF-3 family protein [Treponema sp.]
MKQYIYVFHIGIEGSKPRIWRKLRVPGDFTLGNLHTAIQNAFDWTDSHLHSFSINGQDYVMQEALGGGPFDIGARCEDAYYLDELGLGEQQSFLYLYDFGDSWEHKITVSKILPYREDESAPLCLGGKYSGPPEDCGGVWGYATMLEILRDPRHKDHKETRELVGDFDPLAFDIEEVNRRLGAFKRIDTKAMETKRRQKKSSPKATTPQKAPALKKAPASQKVTASQKMSPSVKAQTSVKAQARGKKSEEKKSEEKKPREKRTGTGKIPDGKLKKLYALMGRIKESKPWEKLWDTEFILIELPGREEPVLCSVMGRNKECFGIGVYPGFASIHSLLRTLDVEATSPFVFMGYQDCLVGYWGQREELAPEERARLKELGISFRGKQDWIFFRKYMPGCLPWRLNSKDADILIETLDRFIDAYAAFQAGLNVNFDTNEIICHRYMEKEKKWITEAGKIPPLPIKVNPFHVESSDVEPLRFKQKTPMVIEAETLFFPRSFESNKEGVPLMIRINVLMDNKTGVILSQCIIEPGENSDRTLIDMIIDFINEDGRPDTIMVRDDLCTLVLQEFCEKIDV